MFDDFKDLPTIEEGEAQIENELRKELELHLIGIKNTFYLISLIIDTIPDRNIFDVSRPEKVCTALLVKVANDLRTIAICTSRGYSSQAATIASSLYESALMIAYVGNDEESADKWINHENPAIMFISNKKLTIEAVKRSSPAEMTEEQVKNEADYSYEVYQQLCMVKHGNPLFQKDHSFLIHGDDIVATPGPILTEPSIRVSWFVIENAIKFTMIAISSFINNHVDRSSDKFEKIVDVFNDTKECFAHIHQIGFERFGPQENKE